MNTIIKNNQDIKKLTMKDILLSLGLIISTCFCVDVSGQSQGQNSPPERRALLQTSMLARQLGFGQEESQAVYTVVLQYELIADSLRNTIADMEERGKAFMRYRELKDKDLKGVLRAEHFQEYIEDRHRTRAVIQEQRKGAQGPGQKPTQK